MKKKQEEHPRVYIEYTTSSEGGVAINPEERWSDRTDQHVTLEVKNLFKTEPKHLFFKDSIEVDPKVLEQTHAFLVVVRYQTGDTFGTSHGNFHFQDVCATQEEAEEVAKACHKPRDKNSKENYRPWDGYFERLEDVEIHGMLLNP